MEYVEWKKEYELGFEQIDLQHKNLVSLLNQLHDFIKAGSKVSREDIEELLISLGNYAVFHFDTEEGVLESNGYPELKAHKAQHEAFKETVANYVERFESGDLPPMEIADFLKKWLLVHIAKEDMAYAPLLKSKGFL
jgi:hemerythrin